MTKKTPRVEIEAEQCKGCELCVSQCPLKCLEMGTNINHLGYPHAIFTGEGRCTGCGICFYACPEPGTITVYKKDPNQKDDKEGGE